jgi:hypothetical protein
MLHLGGVPESSGLVQSQSFRVIELHAIAAAAGTAWALEVEQKLAEAKVFLVSGDGAVDLSAAKAAQIVAGESSVQPAQTQAAAALVTAFTNVPANTLAVVVGGLRGKGEVVAVEVEWIAAATQAKLAAKRVGPAVVLEAGAAMGSANLAMWADAGVLAAKVSSSVVVPSAGDRAIVRVTVKL